MGDKLFINRNVFIIPDEKDYILYAPNENLAMSINEGLVGLLQEVKKGKKLNGDEAEVVKQLINMNVLVTTEPKPKKTKKYTMDYRPTRITLLPTYRCNLRCIYCYARGGEDVGEDLTFDIAASAIDLIIKNAVDLKINKTSLSFLGGGEPLLPDNFDFIRKIVSYFESETKRFKLEKNISACTNGIIGQNNLNWIIKKFNRLNISLDGYREIQNHQRPTVGGGESFDKVISTIRILENNKFSYGLRATVTADSVPYLADIVEFFSSISSTKGYHFEPLFSCGRCQVSHIEVPSTCEFIREIRCAREVAAKSGIKIFTSGSDINKNTDCFCGAAGSNFFVAPKGLITACVEVCRQTEGPESVFLFGQYNKGKFIFDHEKIELLKKREVNNIPFCSDCFARRNCSGDCLAKSFIQTQSLFDNRGNYRCKLHRALILDEIKNKLKMKGGYHEKAA